MGKRRTVKWGRVMAEGIGLENQEKFQPMFVWQASESKAEVALSPAHVALTTLLLCTGLLVLTPHFTSH